MSAPEIAPGRTKIGWIGTGVMGSSMVGHLINAGFSAMTNPSVIRTVIQFEEKVDTP